MDDKNYLKNIKINFDTIQYYLDVAKNTNYKPKNYYFNSISHQCDNLELWLRALRDKLENG